MKKRLLVGYVEWTVEERYQSCLGNNIVSIRQLFKKFRRQLHIEIQRKYEKIVAGFLSLISIGIMLFVVKDKLIEEKSNLLLCKKKQIFMYYQPKRFIHSCFLKMTSKT